MSKKNKIPSQNNDDALREQPVPYRTHSSLENYQVQTEEDEGWKDFREQCRRQMERPLAVRIKYGFLRPIHPTSKKPSSRAFKTMADYREWCEKNMPDYLGYKSADK